jgi:predicted transcriptional regulator of viral defense system
MRGLTIKTHKNSLEALRSQVPSLCGKILAGAKKAATGIHTRKSQEKAKTYSYSRLDPIPDKRGITDEVM